MAASAALSGGFYFPSSDVLSANVLLSTVTIDSANESAANVLTIRKSGTINKIGFRTSTVNTGAVIDVRLETVDTAGNPSGTLYQSSSNALVTITDTDDNLWFTATLGSGTVVEAGSTIACQLKMSATSAGNVLFFIIVGYRQTGFPCRTDFLASAWTKSVNPLVMGFEYSDGNYPPTEGLYPFSASAAATFTTATTIADERGAVISLPFPADVMGAWVYCDIDLANASCLFYDQDTTTVLLSAKINSANRSGTAFGKNYVLFPTSSRMVANGSYRLTFVPDPGCSFGLQEWSTSSNAVAGALDGYPRFMSTRRVDSGAWVVSTSTYPACGLYLNAVDDGVQTGGGGTTAAGVWGF